LSEAFSLRSRRKRGGSRRSENIGRFSQDKALSDYEKLAKGQGREGQDGRSCDIGETERTVKT